ncbi:hypothetical protein P7C70_g1033, partial [Phenoliferia sp. Uapishka_3]
MPRTVTEAIHHSPVFSPPQPSPSDQSTFPTTSAHSANLRTLIDAITDSSLHPGTTTNGFSQNPPHQIESHSGVDTIEGHHDEAAQENGRRFATFLNEDDEEVTPGASAERARQPGLSYSMRSLLRPVGPVPANFLPEPTARFSEKGQPMQDDPISAGVVSEEQARTLFTFFMAQLNTWSCLLDPRFDDHDTVRNRSAFLYTAILCVASLFVKHPNVAPSSDPNFGTDYTHAQISVLAADHATHVFLDGASSLEAVQAFFILSTWKDVDDSSSYLRMGFATKLAMDLDLSAAMPIETQDQGVIHHWRSRQRCWLALFVQDRVQGFQFFKAYTLPLNNPLIQECATWYLHPQARMEDAYLVASVQSRRIQSIYREHISNIAMSRRRSGNSTGGENIMLDTLVCALRRELEDWYTRWVTEFSRLHNNPHWLTSPDGEATTRTLLLWQHSIQLHICSFALKESLADSKALARGRGSVAKGLVGLTSLWPCIVSARHILQSIVKIPATTLRCAPAAQIDRSLRPARQVNSDLPVETTKPQAASPSYDGLAALLSLGGTPITQSSPLDGNYSSEFDASGFTPGWQPEPPVFADQSGDLQEMGDFFDYSLNNRFPTSLDADFNAYLGFDVSTGWAGGDVI